MNEYPANSSRRPPGKISEYPLRKKVALVAGGIATGVAATLGVQALQDHGPQIPTPPTIEAPTPAINPTPTSTPIEISVTPTDVLHPTATATPTETPDTNRKQNWEIFGLPSYRSVSCDTPIDPTAPHYRMDPVLAHLNTQPGYEGSVSDAMYMREVVFQPVNTEGVKEGALPGCYMSFDQPVNIEVKFPRNFAEMGVVLVRAISPDGKRVNYQLDHLGIVPSEDGTMPKNASVWVGENGRTAKAYKVYGLELFVSALGGGPITVTPINK